MAEHVFHSRLRACLFLLLRNDRVWDLLTEEERRKILANNIEHNTSRSDYRDPAAYGGGHSFDTALAAPQSAETRWLRTFLDRYKPESVVELGPGGGFYTRLIVEHPSVRAYHGVDLNPRFVEFLRGKLSAFRRNDLEFSVTCGGFSDIAAVSADAVIMMNTLHHIPDRRELFGKLGQVLKPGGRVISADPSHYLPRIRQLLGKLRSPGYLERMVTGKSITGTHHFCTAGESKKLARRCGFRVVGCRYDAGWRFLPVRIINRAVNLLGLPEGSPWRRTPLHRWLSHWIMVVFERI